MIADLKPYPACKDSGVEWLGEVPEHWEVARLKDAAVVQTGLTLGKSYQGEATESRPSLRVANVQHGRLDLSEVKYLDVPSREAAGSTLSAGDVLMTEGGDIDKLGRGCVWRDEIPGCLHQNHVFAVRCRAPALVPQFLALLMVSRHGRAYFELTAKQTTNLASTNSTTLRTFPVLLPPLEEQSAIVRFLDHVDRRIRRYTRSKQKLITLLNEQKQAIIHRAVTRGLDPSVRLKPSGVAWLGDVPRHWEVARLKNAAVVQTGLTLGKSYQGEATETRPYLRVANVQHGRLDLSEVKYLDVPPREAAGSTLRAGDVLMTEGGDIDKLGRGCVWRDEIPGCLHQNHVFAVRCRPRSLVPQFLALLMVSRHGRAYFELTARQTTNLASTNSTTLRAFPVLLPPPDEQVRIVSVVGRDTEGIEGALARTEREISLLREYRTRLIADVVTGKLDVREAATRLPEETGEPEPLDDTDTSPEDISEAPEAPDPDALEEAEA